MIHSKTIEILIAINYKQTNRDHLPKIAENPVRNLCFSDQIISIAIHFYE